MSPIGFVIMSHQSGGQLLRLIQALNQVYDHPPIGCHHDFSQAQLDTRLFPSNVKFVRPSRRTAWGRMMTVDAGLDALRLLYDDGSPDWFVLLGISDYPIMTADRVLEDLRTTPADAFLDYRSVGQPDLCIGPAANPALDHFDYPENRRIAERWYLGMQVWMPILRRKPHGGFRLGRATKYLPINYPFTPFDDRFRCYNGSHWFSGSRKAAHILINSTDKHQDVRLYFSRRAIPEESYYQTVLCNSDLRIDRHNRRFERWEGGAHPRWLTSPDLDRMLGSPCHFARKFHPDEPVLDQIDEALGIKSRSL
jgi:hypothetical protein